MKNCKRVFVLGAGFSYHLSGKIFPRGSELPSIIKKLNIPDLNKHIKDCIHEPDSIEKILSRLELDNYISTDKKETIEEEIFKSFQKQILVETIYKRDKKIIERSQSVVKDLFKQNDVIISLNYDLLLEHLLAKSDIDMWSPYGNGYGNSIEKDGFTNIKNDDSNDYNQQKQNIRILKVHGSFNFYTQNINTHEYSSLIDVLINEKHDSFFDRENMFENVKNKHFCINDKTRNLKTIIVPSYVKLFAENRTFMKLWHEAIDAMKEADVITIIGYRFPREDSMMSFLFSCPFIETRKNNLTINILNTSDDEISIKKNIKSILQGNPNNIEWQSFLLKNNEDEAAYQNLIKVLNDC
ncbi:MAG TPA: SIR2 family protein [Candidatus Wujingus californicus]|uniref:SIR2 family protein n=1 Tax=Candidatus Wujingus californicus TaxID=3367618 RepID=UPI001E1836CF|nr:SIR2 family protein [Planctomycetota bacterium]